MKTALLNSLYEKYDIANLAFGKIHDKLDDVYEEYCTLILQSAQFLNDLKSGITESLEDQILYYILTCNNLSDFKAIDHITSTTQIPHRSSGGNSKTDVIANVYMNDGSVVILPISCKQSTVAKVALAEFDVDTICNEMGISNPRLKQLLLKHQTDCSAKNFTISEKNELTQLMAPIRRDFVRWVLTGSPISNIDDVCIPSSIIKFKLKKPNDRYNINVAKGDFDFISFEVLTIEECIDKIMYNGNGKLKPGGFAPGLSLP